ncbi:MAG: hypothetical protein Q9217_004174 [Psora testacea]
MVCTIPNVGGGLPTPPIDDVFRHDVKTSGQHSPVYEELRLYEAFPDEIAGPTVWETAHYKDKTDDWTHRFTSDELEELSLAADAFKNASIPLTEVTKGLGTYLGYFVSQNGKGHVLGHVKDLGEDARQIDKVRVYRTNARWDPYYIRSLDRFSSKGIIPSLTEAQMDAAEVLEATCKRLALHMILQVGDIQFLSNTHVLHARTEYRDCEPPGPRRHLMRLWLATPEDEGGWKLPFHDSKEKKRGGIQVDDTAPVANLDAE